MKTISILLSLAGLSLTHQSFAETFDIYVAQANHVSAAQASLSTLAQKNILLDTESKTLRLQLSAVCAPNTPCSDFLQNANFNLDIITFNKGLPAYVHATGSLTLNGQPSFTTIEITLNANNASDIKISNSVGCKTMVSNFTGSPASLTSILF